MVDAPSRYVCDVSHCTDENCLRSLQQDYDQLCYCLHEADAILPRHKKGVEKDWWTPHLTSLKEQSLRMR